MNITPLGEARFASPQRRTVSDQARVSSQLIRDPDAAPAEELLFELAGPRARLFFDPAQTRAGIVTCGGLCPGLNNVIRSLFLELHHGYGVKEVSGFRGGYLTAIEEAAKSCGAPIPRRTACTTASRW